MAEHRKHLMVLSEPRMTMRATALGKRKREGEQTLWIPTGQVAKPPFYSFCKSLEAVFLDHEFDDFVRKIRAKLSAPMIGRPGLAAGFYSRLLLIGYFEGLNSELGIA